MSDVEINSAEQKMRKALEALKTNFSKVRTGRAHVGLLDHIVVEYYGSLVAINQVANINLGDARTINVQPYEKNLVAKIEKAIRDSELGLNPSTQGDIIRVPMPVLTEERRRDLTKIVRGEAENAKVAIRNVRRDANEALKKQLKDKAISEDDERRGQDSIQKATDKAVAEVDQLLKAKEADLLAL